MPKVLAVTTSMRTKWESYSQALLAHHVPEWRRVVVDGRKNWNSTRFIEHVVGMEADYVVHVDEDCFVRSRTGLLKLIEKFEVDKGLVAAGVPDGGHYYRAHNPAALNLFFVVFRMSALRQAWAQREHWQDFRFQPAYAAEVSKQHPALDQSRIAWDEGEPYYPLFWTLMSQGGRFLYLEPQLNRERWSTQVTAPPDMLAEHLWYLRNWFSADAMPGHDCPNRARYEAFLANLRRGPEHGWKLRGSVAAREAWRIILRTVT